LEKQDRRGRGCGVNPDPAVCGRSGEGAPAKIFRRPRAARICLSGSSNSWAAAVLVSPPVVRGWVAAATRGCAPRVPA
jgi:hypothetical protein